MLEALRTAVVTPLVERWHLSSRSSWRSLPVPSGPPVASSEGPDPDRILLFGSGISMGYGMKTHELALAGQIARQVSDITLRGVQVDVVTGEHLTVESALKSLATSRLRELDVIIATPGNLEKLLLMPMPAWRTRIDHLLDHFSANAPASLRVLFVAVPEVSKVVRMPWLLGKLADRSARNLNRVLEASCAARPYADFVQFRPTERAGRDGTGRTYAYFASLIAPSVARALDAHQKVSH
jgi:hypothetical protein